jgi:hypothetical protein
VTLYITPVIYTYLDALQQRFGRRRRVEQPVPELASEAARLRATG